MVVNLTGTCQYATMCGYCTKWDKKCDRKIGCGTSDDAPSKKTQELEYIKSGKEVARCNVRKESC